MTENQAAPAHFNVPSVVLSLTGITKRFGPLVANDHIDLDLRCGEVVALLGENGAGKTTLMNILFGHYVADEGEVKVAGADGRLVRLPPGSPQAALDAGIGMVHQHFTLADNLSAFDNVVLGTESVWRPRRARRVPRALVTALMRDSGLVVDLDRRVGALTVGEKQRVEILKALYRNARVLVLDEPTAVLTPQQSEGLFATLRPLARSGLAVVFISHKLGEVLAVADRIVVLRAGRKAGEMARAGADRRRIAELMVGRDVPASRGQKMAPGRPLLDLSGVWLRGNDARRSLKDVSLAVHEREIVGVAGVSGNGQEGLASLVAGLRRPDAGEMILFDAPVRRHDPRDFADRGVARIPEDRHRDGIVGAMTVAENLILETVHEHTIQRRGFLRFPAIRAHAEEAIRAYDVRCPGPEALVQLLSGGNIQKLILARVLRRDPRLVLANQPTRGLDLGAQADVHRRLLEARGRGAGILLISEDLDEVFAISDRLVVIHDGRLTEAGAPESLDRATLGMMMAGHGEKSEAGSDVLAYTGAAA